LLTERIGVLVRLVLLHFENGILLHFLFDALFKLLQGKLQNLHRLDHPLREDRPLFLLEFLAE
jgi:hypothetical protein